MQAIKEILKQQPYDWDTAIATFEQYGNQKPFARRLRAMGDIPYSRTIIEYQLRLLIGASVQMVDTNTFAYDIDGSTQVKQVKKVVTPIVVTTEVTEAPKKIANNNEQPTEIAEAIEQRTSAYQQRAKLANTLHQFTADDCDSRAAVMQQCEEWSQRIVSCNSLLTYWEQHNQLPPASTQIEEKLPSNPVELVRILTNTRTYLTKAQKKLAKQVAGSEDYQKTAKQIEQYAKKIERAENALKTPK
ncbi:MAG TPA: hypothetical protein PK230_00055 [Chitinophagales bacterium]|nr:hypothetical protein [Chitinophagales bacterium]